MSETKVSRIKSITRVVLPEPIPVYDIEVPKFHNFTLANGIVVHNSKDISDSLAGAVFNATQNKNKYMSSVSTLDDIDGELGLIEELTREDSSRQDDPFLSMKKHIFEEMKYYGI